MTMLEPVELERSNLRYDASVQIATFRQNLDIIWADLQLLAMRLNEVIAAVNNLGPTPPPMPTGRTGTLYYGYALPAQTQTGDTGGLRTLDLATVEGNTLDLAIGPSVAARRAVIMLPAVYEIASVVVATFDQISAFTPSHLQTINGVSYRVYPEDAVTTVAGLPVNATLTLGDVTA